MAGSLEGPWQRLDRALYYLHMLNQKPGVYGFVDSYPVRAKVHREGFKYTFHLLEDVPPPDDEIPFLISECLFNLRSALDHLVYQLHLRHYRGQIPVDVEKISAFPILNDADVRPIGKVSKDPEKWRGICCLGARERTAIKQFQPHIRRNASRQRTRGFLDLLEKLHNIDKHRRVHVAKAIPRAISQHERFPGLGLRQTMFNTPLVADAKVEQWTFKEAATDVPMEHEIWTQIVVDEPTLNLRTWVHPAFPEMHKAVETVLRRFAGLFPEDEPDWRRSRPSWLKKPGHRSPPKG